MKGNKYFLNKKHSLASIQKMSEAQAKRWAKVKANPELYKSICRKISENNARYMLGKKGEHAPGWKGGKYSTKRDGYVYIYVPDHPNAKRSGQGGGGYVLEHRLVMEKILGRYLEKHEDVNHINGDKKDNRPENLVIVKHHAHYEEMCCPNCQFKFRTR